MPILVFTAGPLNGQRVHVTEGGLGIGRSGDNGIIIDDEDVSRYHARVLLDNGTLWLQDAGSRNGIFVNDQRVSGHVGLKVGDRVTIATHVLEVRFEEPETGAEPTFVDEADTTADPEDDDEAPSRRWFWPFNG